VPLSAIKKSGRNDAGPGKRGIMMTGAMDKRALSCLLLVAGVIVAYRFRMRVQKKRILLSAEGIKKP
jgi:hypothetical protein